MVEIWRMLVPLLLAHLLVDFFLQTKKMVEGKSKEQWKSPVLLLHSLLAGVLAYVLTALWHAHAIFWVTALSHWLIDYWKSSRKDPDKPIFFWADQLMHLFVIAALTVWYTGTDAWIALWNEVPVMQSAVILLGFLFLMNPCSIIIQKIMSRWKLKEGVELPKAGHYIGVMERVLILIFLLLQQYAAIGLLITAKSILRFGGNNSKERMETEYILAGTLLSFTLAVFTGIIVTLVL